MIKVSLRRKAISGNRYSLYLDFYPAITHPETGKLTRREFLGQYLYAKPKSEPDKQYNKETLALAESIRSKRQIDLQQEEYGFLKKKVRDVDFIEYFQELTDIQKGVNHDLFVAAKNYLEGFIKEHSKKFPNNKLRSNQIDDDFCNDFREYLLSTNSNRSEKSKLSQNSAHSYFNRFRRSLKHAFKDGVIKQDLFPKIKPIPPAESNREFLSQEELQSLVHTECSMPILKKAALFSALTGLRWVDIEKMTWSEVRHSKKDGYSIKFQQQKTKGEETLPISEQAYNILGERGKPETKVFEGLKYSAYVNLHFKQWILKAGITRDITFHAMRHTYATLLLSNGIDLFTISKMLGHKDLETTQIYAKVIDKKKQEAANVITLNF